MVDEFGMQVIAEVYNDFKEKFGIPRQSGLANEVKSTIVFRPEFRDANAVRGLEGFSHIWLIWQFSKAEGKAWSPTVRPPRLGGNKRMGIFATRSPFRPNRIGLSCVQLEKIEYTSELGPVLHVSGADLLDQTPIFDIKPYLPYVDSKPEAEGGFAEQFSSYGLEVEISEEWLKLVPEEKRPALVQVLAQDPRPAYQKDRERIYGMHFAGFDIKFKIEDTVLKVCEIKRK